MEKQNKLLPALSIRNLVVTDKKGQFLLQIPHFTLESGTACGVYGPSPGAAEVMFRCLTQPQQLFQGEILLFGKSLEDPELRNGQVGVVSTDSSFFPELTLLESLHLAYSMTKGTHGPQSKTTRDNQVQGVIELLGLESWLKKQTSQLPLGYFQRLKLACGLLHNPNILIAEDPWGQADLESREVIFRVLQEFISQGNTLVFSSPRSSEITQLASIIWLFQQKAPLAHGSLESLALSVDTPERIHLKVRSGIEKLQEKIAHVTEVSTISMVEQNLSFYLKLKN